jgi:predicted RNase H-like nuclease (RuvC/YqgF family)
MDIIHKKNQLLSLVQDIVNDYQALNDTFMEQKQNSLQEIQKLNSLIHEQEANVQKQQSHTQTDESEIHRLKKQCYEYEEMIRKLEDKLNEKKIVKKHITILKIIPKATVFLTQRNLKHV